jgi:TolB protein
LPVNWSLDGQRLSYASFTDSSEAHADLWTIPRTGGPRERLLPDLEDGYNSAAWSWPDASKVAYIDIVDTTTGDVWVASADGSDPVNLTQGRVAAPEYPQWSPDGTKIAISAFWLLPDGSIEGLGEVDGVFMVPDKELFVFDVATGAMTRVTDNEFEDDMPAWSPDGQSLIVASDRDGDFDIWRIPLDAPDQAQNLIDDADLPREDSMPDAYWGPR